MVKKLIVGLLLASIGLALVGCDAATASAPGNTTLGGAAIGGLSGAAIGGLASKHHTKGAVIGGLGGAAVGGLIGSQMENNRMQNQMNQMQTQQAYDQGYIDASVPPKRY